MSVWFAIWVVVTQGVNLAFYLAITRAVRGRTRTVGVYFAGYLVPLSFCLAGMNPLLHGCSRGEAGALALGFAVFFCLWGVVTMAMSRGSVGPRLFAVLVCGVHQVGAFAFSLLAMCSFNSEPLGALVGCAVMAAMGTFLFLHGLPLVLKMPNRAGWRDLNITAAMNFALLYVTGIWPMYVPSGDWDDIVRFIVANAVAIVYFPVALAFAERNRTEAELTLVANSMRQMEFEMRARRMAIDDARRTNHDWRHHVRMIVDLLSTGKVEKTLSYARELLCSMESVQKVGIWCENETVNAILAGGERLARSEGVSFVAEADIPHRISVADIDLVAILANLIENAIHASARGSVVSVRLGYENDILRFRVVNAVSDGFELRDGLPCGEPDIGILSVRATVEKYHGVFGYQLEGGRVSACGSVSCV